MCRFLNTCSWRKGFLHSTTTFVSRSPSFRGLELSIERLNDIKDCLTDLFDIDINPKEKPSKQVSLIL